jgi:hypothetical protein
MAYSDGGVSSTVSHTTVEEVKMSELNKKVHVSMDNSDFFWYFRRSHYYHLLSLSDAICVYLALFTFSAGEAKFTGY